MTIEQPPVAGLEDRWWFVPAVLGCVFVGAGLVTVGAGANGFNVALAGMALISGTSLAVMVPSASRAPRVQRQTLRVRADRIELGERSWPTSDLAHVRTCRRWPRHGIQLVHRSGRTTILFVCERPLPELQALVDTLHQVVRIDRGGEFEVPVALRALTEKEPR